MIIIKDFSDTVKTDIPDYEQIKGHILGDKAIVSFMKVPNQPIYAYQLFIFDVPFIRKKAQTTSCEAKIVDAEGFIYDGEAYQIEGSI